MAPGDPEWPVPDARPLPAEHRERAVRHQLGLAAALGALRALDPGALEGIEPAHALQWIAAGALDRRSETA
jgi:hypothetical protein